MSNPKAVPPRNWRFVIVVVPTLLALSATLFVYNYAKDIEFSRIKNSFELQSFHYSHSLTDDFNLYQEIVQNLGSFFNSSNDVTPKEFNKFTQRHIIQHSGIQALEWIPRVPASEKQRFISNAVNTLYPNFSIKKWTENGKWNPSAEPWAQEYYPVYYIQPFSNNEAALGIDLASNPTRLAALEMARDTGNAVATSKVTLAQETEHQVGILIFVPIYQADSNTATIEERRKNLKGFVLGVFRVGDIVQSSLGKFTQYDTKIEIFDESDTSSNTALYDNADSLKENVLLSNITQSIKYKMNDRRWRFNFTATEHYVTERQGYEPLLIGLGGVSISFLIGLMLFQVTGRTKRIEAMVAKRTKQLKDTNYKLEKSNAELQQFAFVASHDLQAPLRIIASFGKILQEEYLPKLDDAAKNYLDRIINNAEQMKDLIRSSLSYSRIDSRARPFTDVDLNKTFDDIVALLEPSINDSGAKVTADPLPTIRGDASQLLQLFQNIISNGIKYQSHNTPIIHVKSKQVGNYWELAISDNGIGISKENSQKVFNIFHRAHSQSKYPGTGIGLAICKRVVERHRGEISLKSVLNEGTTFYIKFPTEKILQEAA